MALTITERFKYSAGGRKFLYVSVLHDESTSTFTAASVDMTYIEQAYDFGRYATSQPATTSELLYHMYGTVLADGVGVDLGYPMKAGSKSHHLLIGW